ncbi:MAG: sulfatase [Candidatus Eisenbacteria sp.]|nr:sulfatase [Candidatus Eisenbacteria bacterium]
MNLSRETAEHRRRPGWTSPLAIGALIGLITGVVEVVILWTVRGAVISHEYFIVAVFLYTIAGFLAGCFLLILAMPIRRTPPPRSVSASGAVAFFAFIQTVGYLNALCLPSSTACISLIVTGLGLVGFVGAGLVLNRAFSSLGRTRWAARVPLVSLGWALAACLFAFAALVSFIPARGEKWRGDDEPSSEINVLFMVVDAARADHLSCYGYARKTSPCIDEWASSGVLFQNALAQAPWTKPSTATLLTGLYPSAHGVTLPANAVPGHLHPLPEILKEAGYRTAIFTDNYFITPLFGFERGVDHFMAIDRFWFRDLMLGHLLGVASRRVHFLEELLWRMAVAERQLLGAETCSGELGARELTEVFLEWLDERPTARFFSYIHFMEPHAPYDPPPSYDARFLRADLRKRPRVTHFPDYSGFLPFEPGCRMSADSLETMVALYDGEILFVDEWIGWLIGELKRRGLYDNTLILLTADHGDEFYEHEGWGHAHSLFQELLHVPLILSCPRGVVGGRRIPHAVRHIDLLPTILEICNIPAPDGIDGASLAPILSGIEPADPPRVVMSEIYREGHFARSLVVGNEKIIFSQQGLEKHLALFDLETDPGETTNLAETHNSRAQELLARLNELYAISSDKAVSGTTVTIDDGTRERLEALGYIQ